MLLPEHVKACLGIDVDTAVLHPGGRVLATNSAARDLLPFGTRDTAERIRTLLHGPDLARLAQFTAECMGRLSPGEKTLLERAFAAVRRVLAEEPDEALETLQESARRIVPWLISERIAGPSARTRYRLHQVIQGLARPAASRLPAGTVLEEREEPSPPCDEPLSPTRIRRSLRFVAH